ALIDQDLPGLCFTAQPRSEVDHASNRRVIEAALVSEGAKRRIAACDAHAEIEIVSGLLPLRAQFAEACPHLERHLGGALARLGYGERIVEKNQDAVTGKAVERAFV